MTDRTFRDGVSMAIRALRVERRWSQRELCRRTELSPAYLSELESAQKDASADVLDRLANAFGIGMDEFLWVVLIGMMTGEIPGVQRRTAAFDLAEHVLRVDPATRTQLEEFVQFQRWKDAGRPSGTPGRTRPSHRPAVDASERDEPDFTEE
jgi:transcriptional regulator with XRE-family HTH domain